MMMMPAEQLVTRGSDAGLRVAHRSNDLIMAAFGPISIAVWLAKPTLESFKIQQKLLDEAVAGNPGRQLFLCVVAPSSDAPEQEIRSASANMITGYGTRLAGCACVIEGSGFRAAITRTVLSGIGMLARTASPLSFFESVESACGWLEKRADRATFVGLASAVRQARSNPRTRA